MQCSADKPGKAPAKKGGRLLLDFSGLDDKQGVVHGDHVGFQLVLSHPSFQTTVRYSTCSKETSNTKEEQRGRERGGVQRKGARGSISSE